MKTALHHKVIAGIVTLSILITASSAAPARADQDDVGRALAAILGLAIVGAVIADSKKDKREKVVVHPQPKRHVKKHPQPHIKPRPLPRHVNRKLLPQHCLRSFPVQDGHMRGFGRRCLNRHFDYAHELPGRCYREVWTDRGRRGVYSARCLRHRGYQLARR